ncbi:MAG: DNA-directed RNA polymerase subunit omega [Flavobacteriales bacterium]|nr:DNA-directed RNA polymerase subunit omega [Flavobacteriales bacterium]
MNYKKTEASRSTETRNPVELTKGTENIYESIAILAKRANQINAEIKEELSAKLSEFATHTDNLDEVFENKEQIEVSRFYERLPKPSLIAIQEWLKDKVHHRMPEEEEDKA